MEIQIAHCIKEWNHWKVNKIQKIFFKTKGIQLFEHEIVTCIPKAKDNNGELTVGELTLGERTQADN